MHSSFAQSDAQLRAIRLTRSFGGRRVLDELSLDVFRGEVVVVMGPSGSGKSVLLRHLIGLIAPDSGQLQVAGEDFWALRAHERRRLRRRFGIAFQEGALFDSMTVFDNVAFPLRRHTSWSRRQIRERVRACLALVRLPGVEDRLPSQLSTGMRRRVGFARAIALEPEFLLFDEPTAGLDPMTARIIDQGISTLCVQLRATTVVVTHDLATARGVAHRVALLFGGKIVADAPVERFFTLPHPAVRQLVEARPEGPLTAGELHPTQGEERR